MREGSAAECVAAYDAPDIEMDAKGSKTLLLFKTLPWKRIVVDVLLVAGILLASSSLLSVR
jgi:hypothetical protein